MTTHNHRDHGATGRSPAAATARAFWCVAVAAVVASVSLGNVACTRTKAKTMPDAPPLEMPAPPPRDVEPNESEPPPPVPLPQEPARTATPRPRPATPTRDTRSNDAPKPTEPPKPTEATPPVTEPPKIEEPPPTPPPTLQTTPASAEGEVERGIRAMLTRASNDLNRIDYRILNADARTQYNTAKSFILQADAAIRAKNLVYAKTVAEKAAALAAQLGGR
jgi:outer membrane biosynthesis protein TonB